VSGERVDVDHFDEFAPVALGRVGLRLVPGDLEMLRAVASVLDPVMSALDRVDLEDLPVEKNLDLGQPPEHVAGADVDP
jgi:hypothetical protein